MSTINDLTSAAAVTAAIDEFDASGREAFLRKYRFRPARSYFLVQNDRWYDSKAIAGAAYGYQFPDRGPLAGRDFVGGDATVRPKLESLGFAVVSGQKEGAPLRTSDRLELGRVYPREELIEMFSITDATINTGVFRPAGHRSIWLFVTRDKTKDRTQYLDELDGDVLHWEGQTSGRTDQRIIDHEQNGDELIVLYRDSKRQHPKAGFRYEGSFCYLSHIAGQPSRFILQRADQIGKQIADNAVPDFEPDNIEDGRQRVLTSVARRQGQGPFRRDLMRAYGGRCAVTGCAVEPLLEAAHIRSYLGPETNHVTNGLVLRADIHTLFDLGLLTVGDDYVIAVSPRLLGTEYEKLGSRKLDLPSAVQNRPSLKSLAWHRTFHAVSSCE